MKSYSEIANEVGHLVENKNAAYGSSFDKAGDFLRLLYPNGVGPGQYTDMLCVVRIFDKLMRIATNKGAFGENPYHDIIGYGLLGAHRYANEEERKKAIIQITKMESQLREQAQQQTEALVTERKLARPDFTPQTKTVGEHNRLDYPA